MHTHFHSEKTGTFVPAMGLTDETHFCRLITFAPWQIFRLAGETGTARTLCYGGKDGGVTGLGEAGGEGRGARGRRSAPARPRGLYSASTPRTIIYSLFPSPDTLSILNTSSHSLLTCLHRRPILLTYCHPSTYSNIGTYSTYAHILHLFSYRYILHLFSYLPLILI